MAKHKIPAILLDYLESTDQTRDCLNDKSAMLREAEWQLYNAYENEASCAYEYHPNQKAALKRFTEELRADISA